MSWKSRAMIIWYFFSGCAVLPQGRFAASRRIVPPEKPWPRPKAFELKGRRRTYRRHEWLGRRLYALKQLLERYVEGLRYFYKQVEAGGSAARLEEAHMGLLDVDHERKLFLAEAILPAEGSYSLP